MTEELNTLLAISPIDGRYYNITEEISDYFSEYAFIKYRVIVEINLLKFFLKNKDCDINFNSIDEQYIR